MIDTFIDKDVQIYGNSAMPIMGNCQGIVVVESIPGIMLEPLHDPIIQKEQDGIVGKTWIRLEIVNIISELKPIGEIKNADQQNNRSKSKKTSS